MHIQRLAPWHAPVFLVNSRYPLACATPTRSECKTHHPRGSPLCRRHGSNLPSSLTRIRSIASVYSTRPPVSVWGTGGTMPHAEAFLDSTGSPNIGPNGPHHHASPTCTPDLPGMRAARLTTENHLRGRLPSCVTPALTDGTTFPKPVPPRPPEGGTGTTDEVSTRPAALAP